MVIELLHGNLPIVPHNLLHSSVLLLKEDICCFMYVAVDRMLLIPICIHEIVFVQGLRYSIDQCILKCQKVYCTALQA